MCEDAMPPTTEQSHTLAAAVVTALRRHRSAVVVVTDDGAALTCEELDSASARLAERLVVNGVGPNDIVPVALERGPSLVVAILAILRAGAAYLPIDLQSPSARQHRVLRDSRARTLVTDRALGARLGGSGVSVVAVDDEPQVGLSVGAAHSVAQPMVGPESAAYVIYTSGSTGAPKGVVVENAGVLNRLAWMQDTFPIGPGDVVLQKTPVTFDVSVWELFWPLIAGARMVLLAPGRHGDPQHLHEVIGATGVTTLHFVPTMLNAYLDHHGRLPASVRQVFCSGEALSPTLVRRYVSAGNTAALHNLYGPTEASIDVTWWPVPLDPDVPEVLIGRPIAGMAAQVLDDDLELVADGAVGELCLAGVGLARGYLHDPDLTTARFPTHPVTGVRWYRTGDVCRRAPSGDLQFIGRQDEQIKLHGQRIELGEIEAALTSAPGVAAAAVAAVAVTTGEAPRVDGAASPEPGERARLVAAVVPDARQRARAGEGWTSRWAAAFDAAHAGTARPASAGDYAADGLVSWTSSFTGEPLPLADMHRWLGSTRDRILSLSPCHLVEIGCGDGLLADALVDQVVTYAGYDPSAEALATARARLRRAAGRVDLRMAAVEEVSWGEHAGVDCVVLNSVIQYFPNSDHLRGVLRRAADVVAAGGRGHIVVGDVRDARLHATFAVAVEHASSGGTTAPLGTVEQCRALLGRARHRQATDPELVVHPGFFVQFASQVPTVRSVQLRPKRGGYDNELGSYRYDVILAVGPSAAVEPPGSEAMAPESVELEVDQLDPARLVIELGSPANTKLRVGVNGVLDARLRNDIDTHRRVLATARNGGDAAAPNRVPTNRERWWHIEEMTAAARAVGRSVAFTRHPDRAPHTFDVVFGPQGERGEVGIPVEPDPRAEASRLSSTPLANDPLTGSAVQAMMPDLRRHLAGLLPAAMIPREFVAIASVPTTSSGKVDRAAISRSATMRTETGGVAARSAAEAVLVDDWSRVLGIGGIGIDDDFLDLGGDSLDAVELTVRVAERGQSVSTRFWFEHRTIRQAAAALASVPFVDDATDKDPGVGRSEHAGDSVRMPASAIQQHMLDWRERAPMRGLYVDHTELTLRGRLDMAALHDAWRYSIERTPARRTSLHRPETVPEFSVDAMVDVPPADSTACQVVNPAEDVTLDIDVLEPSDGTDEVEQRVHEWLDRDRHRGHDPRDPASMRVLVVGAADRDPREAEETATFRMFLSFDYTRVEGWSLRHELETFAAAYLAFRDRDPVPDVPSQPGYEEYLPVLRSQDEDQARRYYQRVLSSPPAFRLATGSTCGGPGSGSAAPARMISTWLPGDTLDALRARAREHHVPWSTVLVAEWARTLSTLRRNGAGHRTDVMFGLAVNGRSEGGANLARIAGQLLNVVPFRTCELAAGAAAWPAVHAEQMELRAHEWVPQPLARTWCGLAPSQLLFDTYLVVQNLPPFGPSAARLFVPPPFGSTPHDVAQMEYPLRLTVTPYPDGLHATATYLADHIDGTTAGESLDRFCDLLECAAAATP
jgi:microcystin synthetase protein McyA